MTPLAPPPKKIIIFGGIFCRVSDTLFGRQDLDTVWATFNFPGVLEFVPVDCFLALPTVLHPNKPDFNFVQTFLAGRSFSSFLPTGIFCFTLVSCTSVLTAGMSVLFLPEHPDLSGPSRFFLDNNSMG